MNYHSLLDFLYGILDKDIRYTPPSKLASERGHLKRLLREIGEKKLVDMCRYVVKYRPEWRSMAKMYSNLDTLMPEIEVYPEIFEMKEGYKYLNKVDKKRAYDIWLAQGVQNGS